MWSALVSLKEIPSEGGVASVTTAHHEQIRSSLNLSKCREEEHFTASSTGHCLQAFGSDLLSNRGGRWKDFLLGRIKG